MELMCLNGHDGGSVRRCSEAEMLKQLQGEIKGDKMRRRNEDMIEGSAKW